MTSYSATAPGRKRVSGFTLVELLVALLVMAVLAGLAWQGIDGITHSRDVARQRMDRALLLNTVLAQWQYDLEALHDGTAVPGFSFDGTALRLVRRNTGGVQVVNWSLRNGVWLRWNGPVVTRSGELQDQWMRSQQLLGNEPGQVRTLAEIQDWQLFCYRDNAWSHCQSSGDVIAPSASAAIAPTPGNPAAAPRRQAAPAAVRSVMTLPDGTLTREFMLGPQLR